MGQPVGVRVPSRTTQPGPSAPGRFHTYTARTKGHVRDLTGADRPIATTIESPEPCRRVIHAEVARTLYEQEYADRLRKVARSHQKPGFRKGHTPKAVLERELGEAIRMEAIEALVPKAWVTAIIEHKLAPVTDPALANLAFKEEGPLKFELVVEVRPEITLQDLAGLPVRRRAVTVSDADVETVVERLRDARAGWETVEREARVGEQVTLDLVPGDQDGNLSNAPDRRPAVRAGRGAQPAGVR